MIWVCCLLAIPLSGPARKTARNPPDPQAARRALLHAALEHGSQLFRLGRYREAEQVYQSVANTALSLGLADLSGRALTDSGACQLALHQYESALRLFLAARRSSAAARDDDAAAAADANIASVYVQTGEYSAAAEWVERSMAHISGSDRRLNLARLQIQMATLRARQGRADESLALFRQGLDAADRAGDLELYAIAWNRLGEEYLQRGDLPRAEPALLQAYYVRKLHHLALDSSYGELGVLRLEQGDLESATTLLNQAVKLAARPGARIPTWQLYDARGRVRLARGQLRDALADLRVARRLALAWRGATSPDDTTRIGAEGKLAQMYSAFVDAGNRLYQHSRDPALLHETFAAEEENRAASLRALLNQSGGADADLPPAYWEALARLQHAEVAALRHQDASGVEAARADLVRLEASLGPGLRSLPADVADACRHTLDRQTVLLTFHIGESASWLWALGRSGLVLYRLPPRNVLEAQVTAAVSAIRDDRPDAAARSAELYATLFGPLRARFRRARRWVLALDGPLFSVPVAALVARRSPRPLYVAERHAVELTPGAAYWLDSATRPAAPLEPLFVGFGDPIYNRADARLASVRSDAAGPLALPRLVGSGTEIEACARAWSGPAVLLRGAAASREQLVEQLRRRPAAVHLAAHYLESAARPGYGLIALTLAGDGQPQLLDPLEISRWRIQAGVVVLSGCHSAAGAALPASGLQGLTRSWLAAGARYVAATLWQTPDDDGVLFPEFYRHLRDGSDLDPPRALQDAQLGMIRSGGWRSRPRYWGAYFVIGRPGKTVIEPWN